MGRSNDSYDACKTTSWRESHPLTPLTILKLAIFGSNLSESNSPTHSFMPLCSS